MRRGPAKHSPETRAKMSATRTGRRLTDEHKAAIAEGLRKANAYPPKPWMTPARKAHLERINRLPRAPRAIEPEAPPALVLATPPSAEELGLPRRSVFFWRWMQAQATHNTVAGRLVAVLPWRTESEVTTEYRMRLAARLNPDLQIDDGTAKAAAEATVAQWREFCEARHAQP